MTYTGRVFEAEEARELGFVTSVCEDPHAEAMAIARSISARNPDAIRADKELLNEALQLDPAQGLLLESQLQDQIIGRPNQVQAVVTTIEDREAHYT